MRLESAHADTVSRDVGTRPRRFHPLRVDPRGHRVLPPAYASGRDQRAPRGDDLQARVDGLRAGPGIRGARGTARARMVDPREPLRPADGLRAAVEALLGFERYVRAAEDPTRRLEGR